MALLQRVFTATALLLTLTTLVATSRAVVRGPCNPDHAPALARYRVEGTCAPPLVADVSLEADACAPHFAVADENLRRSPGNDATRLFAPGGWTFLFPLGAEVADAGVGRPRWRDCQVARADGGAAALAFSCYQPEPCTGTLTPLPPLPPP